MDSDAVDWKSRMLEARYGTMLYVPKEPLFTIADNLRKLFDPQSAKISPPHLTITQPAKNKLTSRSEDLIRNALSKTSPFEVQIGPAITSPDQQLLWFDVQPKEPILEVRKKLHETGLFRTDLPFTQGFLPHLTLSEVVRSSSETAAILKKLNSKYAPWTVIFDSLSLSVPDDEFIFQEGNVFPLLPKTKIKK